MAVVKIIPVKVNVKACVNYVINKDKTDEKTLVSCYGCTERSAETFFKMANHQNTKCRADQKPNLAYHFIQSFPPDENITPEKALEIGREYIKELLGDKYAFVMSTHVDKGHIHNHFVVCASEMDMSGRKMQNDKSMIQKMRKASDKICKENGLSVIENPQKGWKHYKEWEQDKNNSKGSQKTQLKAIIDSTIKESTNWEEFLQKIKEKDIEISQGTSKKYGTVTKYKLPDSKKVCRGYTLGERYTDEKIKERINNRIQFIEQKKKEAAERKANMTSYERKEQRNTLKVQKMFDVSHANVTSENRGLLNWQKQQNNLLFTKIQEEAQEKYGLDFTDFSERLSEINDEKAEIQMQLSTLKENRDLFRKAINYTEVYKANKIYYNHYEKAENKEAYFQGHESQLLAYDEADLQLGVLGVPRERINSDYLSKMKTKLSEYDKEAEALNDKLTQLKKEQADVENWKTSVDIYLGESPDIEQSKSSDKSSKKEYNKDVL